MLSLLYPTQPTFPKGNPGTSNNSHDHMPVHRSQLMATRPAMTPLEATLEFALFCLCRRIRKRMRICVKSKSHNWATESWLSHPHTHSAESTHGALKGMPMCPKYTPIWQIRAALAIIQSLPDCAYATRLNWIATVLRQRLLMRSMQITLLGPCLSIRRARTTITRIILSTGPDTDTNPGSGR